MNGFIVDMTLESTIAGMTVYADNKDDPYITLPDEVIVFSFIDL